MINTGPPRATCFHRALIENRDRRAFSSSIEGGVSPRDATTDDEDIATNFGLFSITNRIRPL
jgi:hypothetical protein